MNDRLPAGITRENDGEWEWFVRREEPPYEITGKYLFFSEDREALVAIALGELQHGGFDHAKIPLAGQNLSPEYVLCLYYANDSRKQELADQYKGRPGLKYRYWKSDKATLAGEYSQEFLDGLTSDVTGIREKR